MASGNNLSKNTNEGGSSTTQALRLPSLKGPRDLSLSAFTMKLPQNNQQQAKKKVYIPNLNVQRNKNLENNSFTKQEVKETKPKPNQNDRGRGRGSRGRGRNSNLIHLDTGLFSKGLAPSLKSSRFGRNSSGGGEGGSGDRSALQKPKLNFQDNSNVNKEEEENRIKELLKDDFVDDPGLEPDYNNCPIKLPLTDYKIFTKDHTEPVAKKVVKTEIGDDNFLGKKENAVLVNGEIKHIKTENTDDLANVTESHLEDAKVSIDEKKEKKRQIPSVTEVLSSKDHQFILLQLPNCMPGLKPETESQRQGQGIGGSATTGNNTTTTGEQPTAADEGGDRLRCTLRNLPAGQVGKLQILKSGRTRLMLGDMKMWLEMGTQVAFKQDLVSVELDRTTKMGDMVCLGSIPLRMMVCPDWDSMLRYQQAPPPPPPPPPTSRS